MPPRSSRTSESGGRVKRQRGRRVQLLRDNLIRIKCSPWEVSYSVTNETIRHGEYGKELKEMNAIVDEAISLRIPESMTLEHAELHEELYAGTQEPGEVGEAARRVADALHAHFEKEEEFALPLLGLLPALAAGDRNPAFRDALSLSERLKTDLPEMLAEHRGIVTALEGLVAAAERAGATRYIRFAEKLKLHARMEEEVSYPTAILIGAYIKLALQQ